jgi:hypothetical protein
MLDCPANTSNQEQVVRHRTASRLLCGYLMPLFTISYAFMTQFWLNISGDNGKVDKVLPLQEHF